MQLRARWARRDRLRRDRFRCPCAAARRQPRRRGCEHVQCLVHRTGRAALRAGGGADAPRARLVEQARHRVWTTRGEDQLAADGIVISAPARRAAVAIGLARMGEPVVCWWASRAVSPRSRASRRASSTHCAAHRLQRALTAFALPPRRAVREWHLHRGERGEPGHRQRFDQGCSRTWSASAPAAQPG